MYPEKIKRKYAKKLKIDKTKTKTDTNRKTVSYFQLFRYATIPDKICIALGTICGIIAGCVQPCLMILFGDVCGIIIEYAQNLNNNSTTNYMKTDRENKLYEGVQQFAIYGSVMALTMIITTYLAGVFYTYSASQQIFRIRKLFLKKILNMDISWYDVNKTGDFATTFTENLSKLEEGIGEKVGIFTFYTSMLLSGITVALVLGWKLALICLVSLPISLILTLIMSWLSARFSQREMEAYGTAGGIADEVLSSIRTVVAFDGQEKEKLRYNKHLETAKSNNIRKGLFAGISNGSMYLLLYGSYALSFWYGIGLVLKEKDLPDEERVYTPANLVSVFFSAAIALWNLRSVAQYMEIFGTSCGAASRVFEILDTEPVINLSKESGVKPKTMFGDIIFKNVSFYYPSRPEVKILHNFSTKIKSGETVAFVGTSGCGKSTCIQLIQRFYDATSGTMMIDGYNIKNLNLTWLRSKIGVVGQEPALFATTIAENIRYGYLSATQSDIEEAAKKANAHIFIQSLPRAYNTVVGERGAQLSGGQKQRIAIARALIRKPKILLLDEATSALDSTSEAEVQAALDAISGECTTVIVAHRLSTIRNANRIVVMSKGDVLEEGSHHELMEKRGAYYNLVISQGLTGHTDDVLTKTKMTGVDEATTDILLSVPKATLPAEESDDSTVPKKGGSVMSILTFNSPEWFYIIVGSIASIIAGAGPPTYGIIFGEIMGILSDSRDWYVRQESNKFCMYFLILGIVTGLGYFIQMYYFSISGERLTLRMRAKMFEAMLTQEMAWFDRKENGVGALCARLAGEAASVQGAAGILIGTVLNSLSTIITTISFAFYCEWRLALVMISFSPVILLSTYYERKFSQGDRASQQILENSAKIAVEASGNIRTVASLGCEVAFYERYANELKPYVQDVKKKMHFRGITFGIIRGTVLFAYAAVMVYGAQLMVSMNLDYGILFKVAETVVVGSWSIGTVFSFSPNFNKGLLAAERIFELLNRIPEIRDIAQPFYLDHIKGDVDYSDVHFAYPARPSVPILNGLNLNILQGKTVALVGSSGCGKSTIIQLLERFYETTSGDVSVDKENIKNLHLSNLRSHLGIVSQEPNLFSRTIAENIAYGANYRSVHMSEIVQAAKSANIHNFIASLPSGYDTNLGTKGTQLSGGQKQRVAIARALISNPRILLLDEATSALDNESERIVQEALDNAKVDRTCITVAHRLTTIQDADVICVLNGGVVAEMGTHNELLERRGLYYDFYKLQSGQK